MTSVATRLTMNVVMKSNFSENHYPVGVSGKVDHAQLSGPQLTNVQPSGTHFWKSCFDRMATAYKDIRSAIQKRATFQKRTALMTSCSSAITPQFIEAGFFASEPYEDGIGGIVIDYIRAEECITFITDEDGILVMYMDSGEFHSKRYDNSLSSVSKVSEFVQDQFCKKSNVVNQHA